jgi:hypothetical protein
VPPGQLHNGWVQDFRRIESGNTDGIAGNDIGRWINTRGFYAASTLYACCVYFGHALTIRTELPLIELTKRDEQSLYDALERVRTSEGLGGEFGIWSEAQDSLGSYVRRSDGSIIGIREFCQQLLRPLDRVWFENLLLFFNDVHMKTTSEVARGIKALGRLIDQLERHAHAGRPKAKGSKLSRLRRRMLILLRRALGRRGRRRWRGRRGRRRVLL